MIRCVLCGSSKMDFQGMGCALCGGSPAVPWEQVHVDEETKTKLLAHADELKKFGVSLEEQHPVGKSAEGTMAAIALGLHVSDALHHGVLHDLLLRLRDWAIPEEQIIRLRLTEPETVAEILREPTPTTVPARRKQPAKSSKKKKRSASREPTAKKSKKQSAKRVYKPPVKSAKKHSSKRSKKR
jgi:hypothetical protein